MGQDPASVSAGEEDVDEGAAYMEQEEIVIKKGKRLKQVKQIKLREYNIQ